MSFICRYYTLKKIGNQGESLVIQNEALAVIQKSY